MKKFGKILTVSLLLISAVFLTLFSQRAAEYARDALKVCALSVVPSLFPYMVISSMIVSSGAAFHIGRAIPVARLYGLPKKAGAAVLIGAVCGFPVGAKTAVSMYNKGELSKTETEVLISASNNTGPSFVVSVVGAAFFGSSLFGWQLYAFQLLASMISAVVVNRLIFPFKKTSSDENSKKDEKINFFSAVSDSASSVLTVSGFIVFFSVISGFFIPFLSEISDSLAGVFSAILEFTGGCRLASSIGGVEGRFLAGLAVGFSGISVFCQTAAFTSKEGLSLKRCFCTKALQGILTGLLAMLPFTDSPAHAATFPEIYDDAFLILSSPVPTALICLFLYSFLIKKLIKDHKF